MLEAHQHQASFFCTLTYDQEHLPTNGSVSVREAQLFLKRLRDRAGAFRYYLVGEYGPSTWRPHYHACLFGLREALAIDPAWGKGFSQVLPLTYELAQYCAGYVVSKLVTRKDVESRGLEPEFARMSLKPGLGAGALSAIKAAYIDPETGEIRTADGDVPSSIRTDGQQWPLGRYLRRRLRGGPEPERVARIRRAQEELRWPRRELQKDRDPKEQKRLQDSRRAAARHSINSSKRGL